MSDNLKGILILLIGVILIFTQDVLIKYTIFDASLMQILVFRGSIGSVSYTHLTLPTKA